MFKNYIKIAWRNLIKDKTFTGLNILGLSIAFAAAILLSIASIYELSFDNFHENKDRLFISYFISQNPGGVRTEVKPRDPAFVPAYAPDDLSANADGYVAAPDINLAEEQMNLIRAETAYKATASLIPVIKDMYEELINAVDKNA